MTVETLESRFRELVVDLYSDDAVRRRHKGFLKHARELRAEHVQEEAATDRVSGGLYQPI